MARAGIKADGRRIVPHSSRHSLASLLEARGVPLRYIQELLGHFDLKTTLGYLHSPEGTIRDIGKKIEATVATAGLNTEPDREGEEQAG
jgi:integrase/recombinase XerD